MNLKQHPLSAAYPSMPAQEFTALLDSITNIGVQLPVTVFEGMVIDGWHRYTAAMQANMPCPQLQIDADIDPVDYVKAMNDSRRHMTASQRAMAAVTVNQWRPVSARGGVIPGITPGKTNAQMAKEAGVSVPTISQAKVAYKAGLTDAVKEGALTLKEAGKVVAGKTEKPAPKPAKAEPEDNTYSGPSDDELQAASEAAKADLDKVMELMESDDPKAELLKENERLRMELATVKSQRDGYLNQANELIRRVKSLKKMLEKAQGK